MCSEVLEIEEGMQRSVKQGAEVGAMKNRVAQLYGTLDKFQFESVDAITTHEIESAKDEARARRKQLNRDIERLRCKLEELHTGGLTGK